MIFQQTYMNNEKFTADVLALVMRYLPSRDKVNCLCVCKAWYHNISHASWFNNLFLKRSDRIIQAQDLFTLKPYLGNQIKHLSLSGGWPHCEDERLLAIAISNIPELVPNVKTLECIELPDDFAPDPSTYAKKWNKLTSLIDQSTHLVVTRSLLTFNKCMFLNDLYITFRIQACLFNDVLKILHNAPVLKRLTMLSAQNVDVVDLEKLHKDLPQLRHLTLRFATANFHAPQKLIQHLNTGPPSQLVSFKFHFCNMQIRRKDDLVALNLSSIAKARWASYIRLKYSHIQRIEESGNSDNEYTFSGRYSA